MSNKRHTVAAAQTELNRDHVRNQESESAGRNGEILSDRYVRQHTDIDPVTKAEWEADRSGRGKRG